MIQSIDTPFDFINAFRACNRADQFSGEGLHILFDHLEEIDPDYKLDVIALCCDYSEETAMSIAKSYSIEITEDDSDEDVLDKVTDYLSNQGALVGVTDHSIVYFNF